MKITGHVNMLEAEGGYYIYIGDNFNWVSPDKKNINFNLFIENEKINMIVVSDQLSMDRRFRDDKQWRAFVKNCAKEGFVKFKISSSDKTIIVKSDLIENKKS
ncbi:MAG TPA: hypothetical protein PK467_03005 [Candidatus Wallbacteria bacterium]|nr:hypothetical protein [Candidatus Wallbacteria bacterium]